VITVTKSISQQPKSRIGCHLHGTPPGQRCDGCQRQPEPFSRAKATHHTRNRRWS
jgi:hypothetical protein